MNTNRPSTTMIWWKTIRPATLLAAFAPVWLGTAVAVHGGYEVSAAAWLALLCAVCIQIVVNLHNDKEDFIRGADTDERVGQARAAQQGWLTPRDLNLAIAGVAGIALAGAIALTYLAGWVVLGIAAISLASAFAYTGGPFPLAYNGLGDLFVFLFFGLVAVTGTTYVVTGQWDPLALLAGALSGFQATAILVVNNIRDAHTDRKAGKRTLVVRWGQSFGKAEYIGLHSATYLLLGASVLLHPILPVECALGFLTLPLAFQGCKAILNVEGSALNPYLGQTARTGFLTSCLIGGGLWI